MRLLSEWRDPHSESLPRQEPQSERARNPASTVRRPLPLLHPRAHAPSHPALCERGGEMTAASRRDFLKTAGALIVSFRMLEGNAAQAQFAQAPLPGAPPIDQVDSWLAIGADGSITAFSGKEELGQGISTAQQQLVAEELSVPFDRVKLIYCDTALTPDQAYTSGSQSHPANFNHGNLAQAGATARETLFKLASQQLGVPVEQLTAADGVISVKG